MKKRLFLILSIIITITSITPCFGAYIPENVQAMADALQLDAESAILIDAKTGDILYQKNINTEHFPASITKLMTILLVLENCPDLNVPVKFSHDAVFSITPGSSHIAIDEGEEITILQSLYAIVLQSANEVSNGVAEHVDGSMEAFATHMTKRAKELGCTNTNFINANGLHDENHYTTANDMALIAKELLKFDFFRELIATTYYEIPPTNKQTEIRYLYGQNQLIKPSSIFYYDYCFGGKTGFTDEARNTIVAYAKQDKTELISVVLKSTGYGEYTDTTKLFDYGFNNFSTVALASSGNKAGVVTVSEEAKKKTIDLGTVNAVFENDIFATVAKTIVPFIKSTYSIPTTINAPINKNQFLGTATFMANDIEIAKATVVSDVQILSTLAPKAAENDNKNPISAKFIILTLICLLVALVVARITINKINYDRRKKKRKARIEKYREMYGNVNDR